MLSCFSHSDSGTPWTYQIPLSWDSPGKNTGAGCHALVQRIFLIQGSNLCLSNSLLWQVDSLPLVPPWKPFQETTCIQIASPSSLSLLTSIPANPCEVLSTPLNKNLDSFNLSNSKYCFLFVYSYVQLIVQPKINFRILNLFKFYVGSLTFALNKTIQMPN